MLRYLFVHQGLRQRGGVLLVVAEFAETDDVDNNVFLELHAVIQRKLRGQHHGLRVVSIHMQHRRLDHLDDVGAVQRGTTIARVAGGKADLVVNDNMHRSAGVVAPRFSQRQRFHHDALPCEGSVSVHQHR